MKMNKKSTLVLVIMATIAIFVSSCKDKFTEEDLLNAQQTIDYSVVIKDIATLLGIEGATVTIVQDGVELTGTTNAQGVATFLKISVGNGFPLTITAANYATVTSNVNISADYRQAEETDFFYTLSQTATLATVKGVVEIETDVTNQTREKVGSGTVTAVFTPSFYNNLPLLNIHFTITATTAADGTYSMQLPTFGDGVEYDIFVNDIEVAQTIAYNREVGQPAFPATLPQIGSILTAFTDSGSPATIPGGVPSVFAVVNATPTGVGAQAATLGVNINALGVVTSVSVFGSGFGYAASSTTLPITITSLKGGTGAVVTANTNASGQVTFANAPASGGSGYPASNPAANVNLATFAQNLNNSEVVRPGDTRVINIYYGTGTSRVLAIQ